MYAEGIIADFAYYPLYYFLVFFRLLLVSRLRILGGDVAARCSDRFYGKLTRVCGAIGASLLYSRNAADGDQPASKWPLGWLLWLGALIGGLLAIVNTLPGGLWVGFHRYVSVYADVFGVIVSTHCPEILWGLE